jgi:hypothetical protein
MQQRGFVSACFLARFAFWCVCVLCGFASLSFGVDKHDRIIGLYDVRVRFDDPAINWEEISDSFIKQMLVDTESSACIRPQYLPMRILQDHTPKYHGSEDTGGLDYIVFSDLFKDASGYYYEAYMVTGKSRLIVLKAVGAHFSDPKEARIQAVSAALKLRSGGTGSRPLAELIYDFEKKRREEKPRDVAIAPDLKLNEQGQFDAPIKMKAGEARKFSFSLIDCDDAPLKGAEVLVETMKGQVDPQKVIVDASGKGVFNFTAPKENAEIQVRVGFSHDHGSEHPAPPEVQFLGLRIGQITSWKGTIRYRREGNVTAKDGSRTYPSKIDETATFTVTFSRDRYASGTEEVWQTIPGTGQATINDQIDEVDQGTAQRTTNTGSSSINLPEGAFRLVFSSDGSAYSLEYSKTSYFDMRYTIYEPGDPTRIFQDPDPLRWNVAEFMLQNIAIPAQGEILSGKRSIKLPIYLVGVGTGMDAEISWSLSPEMTATAAR